MAMDIFVSRKRRWIETAALYTSAFLGLAAVAWATSGPIPPAAILAGAVLGALLIYGAVVDTHQLYIPDRVSIGLFPLGLLATWYLDQDALMEHALSGLAAGLFILAADQSYRLLRGRSGIGMGDAKLFGSAGAWLGPAALPSVLLIGCLSAIAAILVQRSGRGKPALSKRLAFGPHLSIGIWIVWVFGPIFWSQ